MWQMNVINVTIYTSLQFIIVRIELTILPRVVEVSATVVAEADVRHTPDVVNKSHLLVEGKSPRHLVKVKCVDTVHMLRSVMNSVAPWAVNVATHALKTNHLKFKKYSTKKIKNKINYMDVMNNK